MARRTHNPAPATIRSRRHAERRRNGLGSYEVEIHEDGLTVLVRRGLLRDEDTSDRKKVGAVLSAILAARLADMDQEIISERVRLDPFRAM